MKKIFNNDNSSKKITAIITNIFFIFIITLTPTIIKSNDNFSETAINKETTYTFKSKPTLKQTKNTTIISFETNSYCDATVAIENEKGKIIRHLASGVLGANAPKPFKANSRSQSIKWDGKDDFGRYLKNKSNFSVRISLGLKAQFERTLFWSPHKISSLYANALSFQSTKEGVYVLDHGKIGPGFAPQVKLFTHAGQYQKTIYPVPSSQLNITEGLNRKAFPPDNKKFALKWGIGQLNLLTAGNPKINALTSQGNSKGSETSIRTFIAQENSNGQIYLIGKHLNRLSKDTSIGCDFKRRSNLDIEPDHQGISKYYPPENSAISPDGKWIYLTKYKRKKKRAWNAWTFLPGVMKVKTNSNKPPQLFAGAINHKNNSSLICPTSVDCDNKGNVYISDYLNNSIQVYQPNGKLIKSIKTPRPALIQVDKKNNNIYVFSWLIQVDSKVVFNNSRFKHVKETLTIFESFINPTKITTVSIPKLGPLLSINATIHNDGKNIWVWISNDGTRHSKQFYIAYKETNLRVYTLEKNKNKSFLKPHLNFHNQAIKKISQPRPPRHGRQRLYCNPANGYVYIGELVFPAVEHIKSFNKLISLDPNTGASKIINLPFNTEDMTFGPKGMAYLRTAKRIVRYDPNTWKEIPFDYGQEAKSIGYNKSDKKANIISGILAVGEMGPSTLQLGGFDVAINGDIAATFYVGSSKDYRQKLFLGKDNNWEVNVWDKHGKLKYKDALPGIKRSTDIAIDNDGYLYTLSRGVRTINHKEFPNRWSTTLFKIKTNKARVLSSKNTPLPLKTQPTRSPDMTNTNAFGGKSWIENTEWLYGGVGIDGKGPCHCEANSQLALDYFKRSFVVETHRFGAVIVDASGNTILRIGRYGNIEDGMPLIKDGGPKSPTSIGGDEVAIVSAKFIATHTDKRLFIADIGNQRVLSIKLNYHTNEKIKLTKPKK